MLDTERDKEIERDRFDRRARDFLQNDSVKRFKPDGAQSVTPELRRPYVVYEEHIQRLARPGVRVLDLCCGTGLHSLTAARCGAEVTGTDFAENALKLAEIRAARAGLAIRFVCADVEALPFGSSSFDVVTCAGSLSYVDLPGLLQELRRVCRPGGAFIFVDSLNHNPLYRLNRFLQYLRGRRSWATLVRMPTFETIRAIRRVFPDLTVSYHGVFSFMAPLLRPVGRERAAVWLDNLDEAFPSLRRYAFKIVGVGHLPPVKPEN